MGNSAAARSNDLEKLVSVISVKVVWYSGSIKSQTQYPAPGMFYPRGISRGNLEYTPNKSDCVLYSSAPLTGGHSARQTTPLEAMFHKYRHIS